MPCLYQLYIPKNKHNRFKNCTYVIETSTRFGAEAPCSGSFKCKGTQASMHQSRKSVSNIKIFNMSKSKHEMESTRFGVVDIMDTTILTSFSGELL